MFKLEKRGRTYYVHFKDAAGNRQRLSTGESEETPAYAKALEIVREYVDVKVAEARVGRASKVDDVTLTVALVEARAMIWSKQRSIANRDCHIKEITKDIGYYLCGQLTYAVLTQYAQKLTARGNSPATVNRKMSTIQVALKHQHDLGRLPSLPRFPSLKEAAIKERYLSHDEEMALLRKIESGVDVSHDPRTGSGRYFRDSTAKYEYFRDLVIFLVETGCRANEARTLTRDNDRGDVVWLKHGTTKTEKGRCVPLSARARAALTAMLGSRYHGVFNKDWATNTYRFFADQVEGLGDTTLHTLRHTCASRLIAAGVPVFEVMHWLGHSCVEVTMRYAHLAPNGGLSGALTMLEQARARDLPKLRVVTEEAA